MNQDLPCQGDTGGQMVPVGSHTARCISWALTSSLLLKAQVLHGALLSGGVKPWPFSSEDQITKAADKCLLVSVLGTYIV